MKNKLKSFLLTAFCSLGLASVFAQAPTVHTIGDSTMEEKSTDPSVNTNGQRGWPQMLPQFMVNGATLNNRAKSGTSSKTFYEMEKSELIRGLLTKNTFGNMSMRFGN